MMTVFLKQEYNNYSAVKEKPLLKNDAPLRLLNKTVNFSLYPLVKFDILLGVNSCSILHINRKKLYDTKIDKFCSSKLEQYFMKIKFVAAAVLCNHHIKDIFVFHIFK